MKQQVSNEGKHIYPWLVGLLGFAATARLSSTPANALRAA